MSVTHILGAVAAAANARLLAENHVKEQSMSTQEFRAYPQMDGGLEAVMRLHAVKRWHMIDTTRVQTLAEHSANVALLAYFIAANTPVMFFGPAHEAGIFGLVHDVPETFTGDIPTHTKRHVRGIDFLEDQVTPPTMKMPAGRTSDNVKMLVKLCDLADGIRFVRLHGVDITARHAREGLEKQLGERFQWAYEQLGWPEEVGKFVSSQVMFYAYEQS